MRGTRFVAMAALALAVGAAACDNDAGGNNNADEQKNGGDAGAPVGGPDAAAAGTQISPAPPPVGATYPTPADTNKTISTPTTVPSADTGRAPEGNAPGASRGTQPQKGP